MNTDEQIQKDVLKELRLEPVLRAFNISVTVKTGVVILTGDVDNDQMKLAAERAAKRVKGVNILVPEIRVKPSLVT